MRLTSKILAAIILFIMVGGIFFSSALGWWETESTKEAGVYTEGDFAGQANPVDIRGSYTFGDVETNFGVPATLLLQAFGVKADDPAGFAVKSLEEMYLESPQEVGTASVRLFVAFYKGLPIDLSTDMYLPEAAAVILRTRNLSAENAAYLEAHLVPDLGAETSGPTETGQPTTKPEDSAVDATPETTAEHTPVAEDGTIKGKTTFAELAEWGLKAETIELALGKPLPVAKGMTVKDFCSENGLDFETIRTALQTELDKIK